jgi:hypothetical protein
MGFAETVPGEDEARPCASRAERGERVPDATGIPLAAEGLDASADFRPALTLTVSVPLPAPGSTITALKAHLASAAPIWHDKFDRERKPLVLSCFSVTRPP